MNLSPNDIVKIICYGEVPLLFVIPNKHADAHCKFIYKQKSYDLTCLNMFQKLTTIQDISVNIDDFYKEDEDFDNSSHVFSALIDIVYYDYVKANFFYLHLVIDDITLFLKFLDDENDMSDVINDYLRYTIQPVITN